MPKPPRAMNLTNVTLQFDEQTQNFFIISADPAFGEEKLYVSLYGQKEAEQQAFAAVMKHGKPDSRLASNPFESEHNRLPQYFSKHPLAVGVGYQEYDGEVDNVFWDMRWRNKDSPYSDFLAIVGMPGVGKSTLLHHVYNHFVRHSHTGNFRTYVHDTAFLNESRISNRLPGMPHPLSLLYGRRHVELKDFAEETTSAIWRRVLVVDHLSFEESDDVYLERDAYLKQIVADAKDNNDIIVVAFSDFRHPLVQQASHIAAVGPFSPEAQQSIGIPLSSGVENKRPFEAMLLYAYESLDPERRSYESFDLYKA